MDIELGKKYRDKITGFEGIAVVKCDYLYGCCQFGLSPKVDKDGEIKDTIHFDFQRLELVETEEEEISVPESQTLGGPNRDAPKGR